MQRKIMPQARKPIQGQLKVIFFFSNVLMDSVCLLLKQSFLRKILTDSVQNFEFASSEQRDSPKINFLMC